MNLRLYALLILPASLCIHAAAAFVALQESVSQNITSASKQAFGANRLYKNKINQDDISEWKNAINDVESFLMRYARNNNALLTMYRDIKRINNELLKTITTTYDSLFKNQTKLSTQNKTATRLKDTFASLEARILLIEEQLKTVKFNDKSEVKARDTLTILALAVELIITKAGKDIDKEIKARQ